MTLKSDVCDRSGRLLLPAGCELGDKQLKIFRTWGITEADIVRDSEEAPDEAEEDVDAVDPLILAEAEQAISELFRHNDPQHPMIKELMKACLKRRIANVR